MRRLQDEWPNMNGLSVLYADLDGTLLGPGGSLFAASDGSPSLAAARALEALHEAGVALVVMSGRTKRSAEVARVLGAQAYIAELGAFLVEEFVPELVAIPNFGAYRGSGSPFDEIARSGAGALLLDRFPGRLRPVAPWTEAGMMFHGFVEPDEVNRLLADAGHDWLELLDNGRLRRTYPELDVPEVRAYTLLPKGVSKASAVRLHRERHGVPARAAAAVGDSPSDLLVASEVAAFFLVANGRETLEDGAELPANVFVTAASRGDGFAEAVESLLA